MKTLKVIGLLALVFLAGFAGGIVATRVVVRRLVADAVAHPEIVRVNIERNLDLKLRLDQDQRARVHDILKDSHDKLRVVREEFQPQLNAIILDTRTNISAVLRPAQEARFEQFLEDNRQFLPFREPPPPKK
jgi:hypothetical protein